MSRPFYQSPKDLKNEFEVVYSFIKLLSKEEEWYVKKLALKCVIDFGIFSLKDKTMKCAVEIRCRDVEPNKYPDIMCNIKKHQYAELFDKHNIPTYFIVRFKNGELYFHKFNFDKGHYKIVEGGRNDRNDWQDLEPVICIPMEEMKRFK